jgi:hypothetical protein
MAAGADGQLGETDPEHHDSIRLHIGPQRLPAVKESADFVLVVLDHLDAIACQSLCVLPPGLRCGPPQCVVLVDVTWPDHDHVQIPLGIGVAAGEGSEHEDFDRGNEGDRGAGQFVERRLPHPGQRGDRACCNVLGHEPEKRRGGCLPTLDDGELYERRQHTRCPREAHA